jgi:hypothetical protein
VRIVARRTLREFWNKHADAEQPLRAWYQDVGQADWSSPADVKRVYANAIDALLYHMESRGLTRRDLEQFLGSRARVAEVLNRSRPLTIEMIRKLHDGLGISADVLIRQYSVRGSAA